LLRELKKMDSEKVDGLVLDLRNNGGGALTDAIKTAGLFIKAGPVVQVKASDGKISVLSDDEPSLAYGGPLVILVNKFSASASEILAGALQDYGRAVIIGGEHTHGKGTVQSIIDLNNFFAYHGGEKDNETEKDDSMGALRLTTQKFYRITGESTQYRGVTPDIVLPDLFQGLKSGEQYLDFALPWDTIQSVPFSKWQQLHIDLRELRARSGKRVSAKQEFIDIADQTKELLARQKKTLQPLNLEKAEKELKIMSVLKAKNDAKKSKGKDGKGNDLDNSNLSDEERQHKWLDEVREDPYIQEGIAVLTDVIAESSGGSLNDSPPTSLALTPMR